MNMREMVEGWLAETGKPWSIETGKKHLQVRLDGQFVAVLPRSSGPGSRRGLKNVRAQIRRAADGRLVTKYQRR